MSNLDLPHVVAKLEADSLDAIVEVIGAPKSYNDGKAAMRDWFIERLRRLTTSRGPDPSYDYAVGVLIRTQRASTSFLQREMGITYLDAVALMERAEADGIVSKPNHVGKREVIVAPPGPREA